MPQKFYLYGIQSIHEISLVFCKLSIVDVIFLNTALTSPVIPGVNHVSIYGIALSYLNVFSIKLKSLYNFHLLHIEEIP